MAAPIVSGVHHLTFPVGSLPSAVTWFEDVFGAARIPDLDHHDSAGELVAVVVRVPGLDVPVLLRHDDHAAARRTEHEPVTFGVADLPALQLWSDHLDELGVDHDPISAAMVGYSLRLRGPDGVGLRLQAGTAPTRTTH